MDLYSGLSIPRRLQVHAQFQQQTQLPFISRSPIVPTMATTVSSIAFSEPAASFRASGLSNRSRIGSSSSFVLAISPLKSVSLREGCIRAEESLKEADVLPSGEWPETFCMLNYEDLSKHYERYSVQA